MRAPISRVILAVTVVLALSASQVSAADFMASARKAVEQAASQPSSQVTQQLAQNDENPYLIPGLALLGGGGLILVYGAVHETGLECSSTISTANCQTTHSTGVVIAGAAVAGLGAFLLFKGSQHKSSPELITGPGRIGVRQRLSW